MQLKDNSIRIFVAGDFCSTPSTKPITVSDDLKAAIASCDLKVCNFEVPLKPDKVHVKPGWFFCQSDDAPAFLQALGFNLFPLANNHMFDYGDAGFLKTKNAFRDKTFGAGTYDEAYKVKIVEVDGVKIGFMALCFAARFGVFNNVADHEGLGCAYINDLRVNHAIIDARKKVDYLIILPHDGIEYIDIPMPETVARYRDFIDYGADAVIGTHPHCPQGWETYKGKPIFYSLGNFLFNSKKDYSYRAWNRPHWYEGLCVILKMDIPTHYISFEIINTRNVDNLKIVIDNDETRNKHNGLICSYLSNCEKRDGYLRQLFVDLGTQEMSIIDKTFHPETLKECTKLLIKYWGHKVKGKKIGDDYWLLRLLTDDARRNFLLLTLKQGINKHFNH